MKQQNLLAKYGISAEELNQAYRKQLQGEIWLKSDCMGNPRK